MIRREVEDMASRSGAIFSDCGQYRFRLWREWEPELLRAVFCLMNPSKADEIENDPTIERQQRRVMQWNQRHYDPMWPLHGKLFGRVDVVNVFAYRETDSSLLPGLHQRGVDLIGDGNDEAIMEACRGAAIVICGWGAPGLLGERHFRVVNMLRDEGIVPMALKINNDGTPTHPLYLGYGLEPFPLHYLDRKE